MAIDSENWGVLRTDVRVVKEMVKRRGARTAGVERSGGRDERET